MPFRFDSIARQLDLMLSENGQSTPLVLPIEATAFITGA